MARLSGKRAFISGGTGGIGAATALMFGREGARIAVASRRAPEGEAVVQQVKGAGGEAFHVVMDVGEEKSVEEAMALAVERLGGLDVLVSNAGGSSLKDGPVTTAPLDEFWRTTRVNLFGAFLCARFGVPHLVQAGGGSLINMASIAGFGGAVGRDAYTAAKAGVIGLTKVLAKTYVKDRVRVNAIAPAAVASDRIKQMLAASAEARAAFAPQALGLIEPEEIASLVAFLASDESRSVTGQIIAVNGGNLEG